MLLNKSQLLLIVMIIGCMQCENISNTIYGVRWFLGDKFSYSNRNNTDNHNYYVLMFNSDEQFKQDVYVSVGNTIYTCTNRNLSVPHYEDNNETSSSQTKVFINRCYVNANLWEKTQVYQHGKELKEGRGLQIGDYQVGYEIYSSSPDFKYKSQQGQINEQNIRTVNRDVVTAKTSLFQGYFRPVSFCCCNDLKLISFGDWGEVAEDSDVVPILSSLLTAVEQDARISITLFLGDLAYEFFGPKYYSMLKYMQPLTSRIVFMTSPGNHDYIYHEDSFQLFAESFISPQWDTYYNFYYTIVIGDLLLIQYVPQNILYNEKYRVNVKPIQYMLKDLYHNQQSTISTQYHVIVFTHYPIYCSQDKDSIKSCDLNDQKLAHYRQLFQDIGIDFYLSGHEHYYERMHEICFETRVNKQYRIDHRVVVPGKEDGQDVYTDGECPSYVIEGDAGNDLIMEKVGSVTPKPYSAKISYGSGFGILTYKKNQQFSYQHYTMTGPNNAQLTDQFIKKLTTFSHSSNQQTPQNQATPSHLKSVQISIIVLLIIMIPLIFYLIRRHRNNPISEQQKKLKKDIEYVQQNFNTIRSEKDEDNIQVMNSLRSQKDEQNIQAMNDSRNAND